MGKRVWRNHPVLCAALVGGVIGLVNAAIVLSSNPLRPLSDRLRLYLFPASIFGFGFDDGTVGFSIFVAIVEVGGNAFLYASAFATPVAAVIAVRRQFGTPEEPTSITGS
jgi:hypothetical protein